MNMNADIPITKNLSSGTLDGSGVKYYICRNDNPNDSIVLTLIVHVGSLMENDDEQGLAHFIEHLGFKSTKSFEHYELVKFLESLGISYGPDLNASTHLLETVFRLNIKFDDDCSQLAMGINVLSEWAYHMSISDTDVVEERQVIAAEYMAKQGVGNRLLKQYWKAIFDTSNSQTPPTCEASALLSKRFPIGIPEVFMQCDHTHIRDFYQKWYRPENMSVLVCGSVHNRQEEILSLLEKAFTLPSHIPQSQPASLSQPPATPTVVEKDKEAPSYSSSSVSTPAITAFSTRCQQLQEKFLVLPTLHTKEDVVVAMVDTDLSCTQICFEFFSPVQKSRTTNFIRQDILRRIMSSVLDKRFNELHKNRGHIPSDVIHMPTNSQNIASPFLSVQISIREFVRGLVCVGVSATLKDILTDDDAAAEHDEVTMEVAIQCLLLEMKRLRLLGVNVIELETAKSKWMTFFTQQHQKNHIDNAYMVTELQNFVLNGENVPFATPSAEAKICMEVIESVTIEELNSFLSETFDMDVMEADSVYYEEGKKEREHCFRALSGQFPRPFGGCAANARVDGAEDSVNSLNATTTLATITTAAVTTAVGSAVAPNPDERLRSVLVAAREIVARRDASSLQEWPCHVQIEESRVLAFAQQALATVCAGNNAGGDRDSVGFDGHADSVEDTILEENVIESLHCSEFLLSNGITVCCKWMPTESQDKVSMQGFALGGSSELSPVEDLLMSGLDELAGLSTSVTRSKGAEIHCEEGSDILMLEGKDISELQSLAHTRVNTQRHQYHRGIGGSATKEKLELLLAFLVIKMTSQHIDQIHFEDWINKKRSQLTNQSNSPEFAFMNRSRILACGDDPNSRPITLELLQEAGAQYSTACNLYTRAFKVDPTEFSFVFTGDIGDKEAFKALLVKYLGKLRPNADLMPSVGKWLPSPTTVSSSVDSASPVTISMHPFTLLNSSSMSICGPMEESMHLLCAEDNKSSMMVIFRADMRSYHCDDEDLMFATSLDAACRVLQVYLLDELRIKLGKVYNVNVENSRSSLGTYFLISIGLHCQPSDVAVIKAAIQSVVQSLQSVGPEVTKLNSVAEVMCKTHKDASNNASYWLFWILDSYKAYKLHEWRCIHIPDQFVTEPSCNWLERNGCFRATGKVLLIKDHITCEALQHIYTTVFCWDHSLLMTLLPTCDAEGGRKKAQGGREELDEQKEKEVEEDQPESHMKTLVEVSV